MRLGPSRSLTGLLRAYRDNPQNAASGSLYTLQAWSKRYGWQDRASLYDASLEEQKNLRIAEIMQSGLALTHERVRELKDLAEFLKEQIYETGKDGVHHNVWMPDVKQVGSGENAERVDIERFNSALLDQFRSTLDDIAKETGGRAQKQELTGKDGGPIIVKGYIGFSPDEWDTDDPG